MALKRVWAEPSVTPVPFPSGPRSRNPFVCMNKPLAAAMRGPRARRVLAMGSRMASHAKRALKRRALRGSHWRGDPAYNGLKRLALIQIGTIGAQAGQPLARRPRLHRSHAIAAFWKLVAAALQGKAPLSPTKLHRGGRACMARREVVRTNDSNI